MMMCREYIFRLTSGQLATDTLSIRLQARMHRLGCPTCRQFTRNNELLDRWLDDYRRQLHTADPPIAPE